MTKQGYPVGKPFQEQGQWFLIDPCKAKAVYSEPRYSLLRIKGLETICTCGRMEVIERKIRERVGKDG